MDKDWRPTEKKSYDAKRETPKAEPKTEQPKPAKTRFETYDDSQPSRKYDPKQHEHHMPSWWWIPLAIILFIIVVTVLVNSNDEETSTQAPQNDAQTQEITTLQGRLTSCEQALATKTTQPAAPTEECAGLTETAYLALKRDLDTLQKADKTNKATINDQEKIIADAARRICCAQRIENNAITGYEISSNKITCVESGGETLSC